MALSSQATTKHNFNFNNTLMESRGLLLLLVPYLAIVAAQESPRGEPFDELDVAPLDYLPATADFDHVVLGNALELVHVAGRLVR